MTAQPVRPRWPHRRRPEGFFPPLAKFVSESRTFSVDLTAKFDPAADPPVLASLCAAASGPGELTLSGLMVTEGVAAFSASNGQPRRSYTLTLLVTTESGLVWEYAGELDVLPVLEDDEAAPAPSSGFGPPIVWTVEVGAFDFSSPDNSALLLLL